MNWIEIVGYAGIGYVLIGAGISASMIYDDYKKGILPNSGAELFAFSVITVGWLPFIAEVYIQDFKRGFD